MRLVTMSLIGIGVGNSNHLTLEAIETLNRADLVLIPHKGEEKADLGILRIKICDQRLKNPDVRRVGFNLPERGSTIEDYRIRVDQWHNAIDRRECGNLQ